MKHFILIYFLAISFLFITFYWEFLPFAHNFNLWQTNLISTLTSFTLANETMRDNQILINPYFTLVIDKECNGFIPYFFFLASIIAFPSTILHKIKWAIWGYLILSIINVFRIWIITQFVMSSENNFSLAHDYLGNLLLIIVGLLLFIGFIRSQ